MTDNAIEGYCMKCREKIQIAEPQAEYSASGRPATRGTCPQCGTTVVRMGATSAHETLEKPPQKRRSGRLVIVESPAKARTVSRFLGRSYNVKASVGHVRDLLRSQLSVDVEHDFSPRYRVPNEKKAVVRELKEEAKRAEKVYLATDPDREGEAIAWHLLESAEIEPARAQRVVFHEITRESITEAFSHPRELNYDLVDAQQARRILDRLVGYKISPLLWEKVRNRTTAGRVQSVAVRMIVDREREIEAFVSEEYWSIEAELSQSDEKKKPAKQRRSFRANLHRIDDREVRLINESQTEAIVEELERSVFVVSRVKHGERRRKPAPPFITSTLQQDASRRLGFTARRTMATAQALYEGISLGDGDGLIGLITYMRTDSVNVAVSAQQEARGYIQEAFGSAYLPKTPPQYKTKSKGAQEAHEAIRPTSVWRTPEKMQPYLSKDQFRLYQLIWNRFVASQMNPAIMDTISVDISAGLNLSHMPYLFRVSGSSVRFPGFLAVYEESADEDTAPENGGSSMHLLPLKEGEHLDLLQILSEQHFTQPPPRYTEATLVRDLEEKGIGRPSTYAPILSTIQARGYVERVDRRLIPTELGMIVNDLLVRHFSGIVDLNFTAKMEEDLDRIASGELEWVPMLRQFYIPFEKQLHEAEKTIEPVKMEEEETGEVCEKCGHKMVVKYGRFGKFIACSNYPECRNTKPYLEKIDVTCPDCCGDIVRRRSRRGRIFYGCANYPECNFSTWKEPLRARCPACGGMLVNEKKDMAKCIACQVQFESDKLPEHEPA